MATGTTKHTLTTAWTQIDGGDARVIGKVLSGSILLHLGTTTPTGSDGVPYDSEESFQYDMGASEELWARAGDNSGADIRVTRSAAAQTVGLGATDNGVIDAIQAAVEAALGPGAPSVDSYAAAVVDLAASTADQEIIAAPGADKQIWVYGLALKADIAAGTLVLQDEDDAPLTGTMAVADEGDILLPPSGNFAMPWFKVPTNKALEGDTGACTLDGVISYAVVDVS